MNMKFLTLLSLMVSTFVQATDLSLEQLEAQAKNTSEYKEFKRCEEKFLINAKVVLSMREKCQDKGHFAYYFGRECFRAKDMLNITGELAKQQFKAAEVWQSTPEYQAWKNAENKK